MIDKKLISLVENYRKSKKDTGDNKNNRRTQLKPEKLYSKYNANDGDFTEISKINRVVEQLSKRGFITSTTETFGTQLKCIYLVDEKIQETEKYLAGQYGYISKDAKVEKMQKLIERYQDASAICKKECGKLTVCMENRKVPGTIDELDDILKAVAFIERNREELYIREVSVKVYGDSKYFENETL